jgi:hypothetical protein
MDEQHRSERRLLPIPAALASRLQPVTGRMPAALKRRRRRHNKRVLYRSDPAAKVFGLRRDLLDGRPERGA